MKRFPRFTARPFEDRRRDSSSASRSVRPLPKRSPRSPADARSASRSTRREVDSFLAIHPDGSVTLYTSKVDVGTGSRIADPPDGCRRAGHCRSTASRLVEGDTALTPDHGGTGGSTGITARRRRNPPGRGHRAPSSARLGAERLNGRHRSSRSQRASAPTRGGSGIASAN